MCPSSRPGTPHTSLSLTAIPHCLCARGSPPDEPPDIVIMIVGVEYNSWFEATEAWVALQKMGSPARPYVKETLSADPDLTFAEAYGDVNTTAKTVTGAAAILEYVMTNWMPFTAEMVVKMQPARFIFGGGTAVSYELTNGTRLQEVVWWSDEKPAKITKWVRIKEPNLTQREWINLFAKGTEHDPLRTPPQAQPPTPVQCQLHAPRGHPLTVA